LALQDAGVEWKDMQFAFGGSASAGNADALGNELGLTGIPFINVANGCATGGSSLMAAYAAIKSGEHDIGLVAGFDKHDRGAFNADPAALGIGQWYGEVGLMMTTQFFAMKIQKYMHDYGISATTHSPSSCSAPRRRAGWHWYCAGRTRRKTIVIVRCT
jgi:acetyl-CoA acetyltransferase